jgi:hypothetical protein
VKRGIVHAEALANIAGITLSQTILWLFGIELGRAIALISMTGAMSASSQASSALSTTSLKTTSGQSRRRGRSG